jgi:RecB family exonuclease
MADLPPGFSPFRYEVSFGLHGAPPLELSDGRDTLRLRGVIDRVDRSPDGRLRIIDYKSAGPWGYGQKDVREGRKLQLPIYALAARDALGLGEPVEGFYWHVRHGVASGFRLSGGEEGPAGTMAQAAEKAWDMVRAVRRGRFAPRPPEGGCPEYCPAAAFCWQYRSRRDD